MIRTRISAVFTALALIVGFVALAQPAHAVGVTVDLIGPDHGPKSGDTSVVISGSGFSDVSSVTFGGVPVTGMTVFDDSTMLVYSPAGTGSVTVTVNTFTWGSADAPMPFVYDPDVPGAPTNVQATAGDGQIDLSWDAPVDDGGGPIYEYTVNRVTGGSSLVWSFSNSTSVSLTSLTNGTEYCFNVAATNSAGTGPTSAPDVCATPTAAPTAPGAPTNFTVTPGNGEITFSWDAPVDDGGSALTGYSLYVDGSEYVTLGTSFLGGTMTPVTNGQEYCLAAAAVNAIGTGAQTAQQCVTPSAPATVPGTPTGLMASAGNAQVSLLWTAPADGGSPITGYTVAYYPTAGGSTTTLPAAGTSATVTGLTNGTDYTFYVYATNAIGNSNDSSSVVAQPSAPVTVPGTPSNVVIVDSATPDLVDASWDVPASDGGSAITGYDVTWYRGGSPIANYTASGTTTQYGSIDGTEQCVTVAAINGVGTGTPSAQSCFTPSSAPEAPTSLSLSPGNGQVEVTWADGADNGAAIDGYRISVTPAGMTISTSSNPYTVTGLANGTEYCFTVAAHNTAGWSAASSSQCTTPVAPTPAPTPASGSVSSAEVPGAPTNVTVTYQGDGKFAVTWGAPAADGGSALTAYNVSYAWPLRYSADQNTPAGFSVNPDQFSTEYTFTDGNLPSRFCAYVTAVNGVGGGQQAEACGLPVANTGGTGDTGGNDGAKLPGKLTVTATKVLPESIRFTYAYDDSTPVDTFVIVDEEGELACSSVQSTENANTCTAVGASPGMYYAFAKASGVEGPRTEVDVKSTDRKGGPVLGVNRTDLPAGAKFRAGATNVAQGCLVQIQVRDGNGNRLFSKSRMEGDSALRLRAPNQPGPFFVSISVYGKDCKPAHRSSVTIPMTAT